MTGSLKGILIIVSGVVQGVGFRWYVRQVAMRYGLKGYVKNLFDGSVETYVEGDETALKAFNDEIKIGPRNADITGVKVNWSEYTGKYDNFRILS
jgi:acylphosphatase